MVILAFNQRGSKKSDYDPRWSGTHIIQETEINIISLQRLTCEDGVWLVCVRYIQHHHTVNTGLCYHVSIVQY